MAGPALVNKNGFRNFRPTVHHGPLYCRDYDSDGSLWLPAVNGGFYYNVGTWTNTRAAGGDYYSALTAAANSPIVVVDLSQVFDKIGTDPIAVIDHSAFGATFNIPGVTTSQANGGGGGTAAATGVGIVGVNDDYEYHILRGIMLTGYDVIYTIATAGLTTFTGTCFQTTYDASHTAGTVVTTDAAQNLTKTTSTNVIVSTVNVAVPYVIGKNASVKGTTVIADYLELNITNPGTSVLHLYGVRLYFDYCLM